MIVNRIELSDSSFDADRSLHKARVTLNVTGPNGEEIELSYSCHTAQPADCPSTLVLYGLVKQPLIRPDCCRYFARPGKG